MEYRELRTITGRRLIVRMSREEILDRRIFRAEVILAPLVMILVFAMAGGLI